MVSLGHARKRTGCDPGEFPEANAAYAREWAIFHAMTDMVPTTLDGIAALASVLFDHAGPQSKRGTEQFYEDCKDPTAKLMISIWRAASGQNGTPVIPQVASQEGAANV